MGPLGSFDRMSSLLSSFSCIRSLLICICPYDSSVSLWPSSCLRMVSPLFPGEGGRKTDEMRNRTSAPADQSLQIFTGVFVIVWLGSIVVTLNAKLLGGKVSVSPLSLPSRDPILTSAVVRRSFFQSLCVLGYCIFPLDLAALVAVFVRVLWVRVPVCAAAFGWSIWGTSPLLSLLERLELMDEGE